MSQYENTEQSDNQKWCVLVRRSHELGVWSWVCIITAPSAAEALRESLGRSKVHGYYVALPWDVAARAETTLSLIDPEGNRI